MTVPVLTDPTEVPTYAPTAFQRMIESWLHDPRDAVFVRLTFRSAAIMVPLIVALFVHFTWWLALTVFVVQVVWLNPPIILMLHNTMHRPFLKTSRFWQRAHPYSMSALFGIPTGYMEHHVGMHHVENNLRADLSSTMRYQRDNFFHWLHYVGKFLLLSHFAVPKYLANKNRMTYARRAMVSEMAHLLLMTALGFVNGPATIVAFVVPYVSIRTAMMAGNWGQHAFIDATRPGDSYVNSITCINAGYNARCFNDGYHIGHHIKQNRHWAELPADFLANVDRYAKEGCVVFEGLDFFIVSLLLWTHQYGILARHFVRLPGDNRTDAEVIAFLKTRTKAIPVDAPEGVVVNA